MSIAITTIEKVKNYMGITDTEKDDLFTEWLEYVSGVIEDYLNQAVIQREVTEYLDGSGDSKIYTQKGRIASLKGSTDAEKLASLQLRDSSDYSFDDLMDDIDAIYINTDPLDWYIELLDGTVFTLGSHNIKVVYNCGWLAADVPPAIVKVCLEMMQVMYDESKAGMSPRLGMASKSTGAAGMSAGDNFIDMNPRWKSALARWRRL